MPRKESHTRDEERREWAARSHYDGRIFLCLLVGAGSLGLALGYASDGGRSWLLVPPLLLVTVASTVLMVRRDRAIKRDIREGR